MALMDPSRDTPAVATDALGRLLGGLYERVTELEDRIRTWRDASPSAAG